MYLKIRRRFESTSFDFKAVHFGDHADAWPAVTFHLVVVFQTGDICNHI